MDREEYEQQCEAHNEDEGNRRWAYEEGLIDEHGNPIQSRIKKQKNKPHSSTG